MLFLSCPLSKYTLAVRMHVISIQKKPCVLQNVVSLFPGILLCDAVRHVGRDGAHLRCALHVEHLVIEVDVGTDLLQHGALGGPSQEQGFVDLQAPGPQCLEGPDTRAGGAAGRHQVGPDGTVHAVALGVELLLELAKGLQEALQRALQSGHGNIKVGVNPCSANIVN